MTKGSQNCFAGDVVTADRTESRKQEKSHKRQNNLNLEYTYKTWIWCSKKGRGNGETKERERNIPRYRQKRIIVRTVCWLEESDTGSRDVGFIVIKRRPETKREMETAPLANIHPDSETKGNAFKSNKVLWKKFWENQNLAEVKLSNRTHGERCLEATSIATYDFCFWSTVFHKVLPPPSPQKRLLTCRSAPLP